MPTAVVIPCFDEAERLDLNELRRFVDDHAMAVVVVDDGSGDTTLELLRAAEGPQWHVVEIAHGGKAAAVRVGLEVAAALPDVTVVGFCDADLATPVDEVARVAAALDDRPDACAAIAVRTGPVASARGPVRRLGNRAYSRLASRAIGQRLSDTQCGAKFMGNDERLRRAIDEPFGDRWGFDAELLGRVVAGGGGSIIEVPLNRWREVPGSRLSAVDAVRMFVDVVRLPRRLRTFATG